MKKVTGICLLTLLFAATGFGGRQKNAAIELSSAQAGAVKAMTFNIRVDTILDGFNRWSGRRQAVIETIARNSADVIGLQEALNKQVEDIAEALPQYSNYAAGRKNGKQKGESCAIFYRTDRFALKDNGTFWFSDTPSVPGSKDWGDIWPRICSWVHLVEKSTGQGFYVYNVHLSVFSQNAREKSAELLAEQIAARKTADPFIVMGDFNMTLDNSAMAYLQNAGMTDALRSASPEASEDQIDHIPVSAGVKVLDAYIDRRKIDGERPSDHFPVIAKLFLASGAIAAETNLRKNSQLQAN